MKYIIVIILLASCSTMKEENLTGRDVRIYKDTPVWEVALAIRDNDTAKVRQLLTGKPYSLLNYREKYFGQSLLNWAVYRDSYNSAKVLAELGADPNLKANDSTSAMINAADKAETSDYVKLILKHGGNPNAVADIDEPQRIRTPLIAAAFNRLESVKLLVEAGADPNFTYRIKSDDSEVENLENALITASRGEKIDIVRYLIIDAGADFNYVFSVTIENRPLSILSYFRDMLFPLNSEKHKVKMEVVQYLKEKGLDYWKEPIPNRYYKNYDKDYLEKY